MWKRMAVAIGCVACMQCGDDNGTGAVVPNRIDVATIAGTWHAASSERTVDSVVCARECYTVASHWETLSFFGADSSTSRLRCAADFSEYVSQHSLACDTIVVAQTTGNSQCALDTGRWYASSDTLCLVLGDVTECYMATVNVDASVLSLTDAAGVVTRYSQRDPQ